MKANGIKSERETIVKWNEEDETASIWTASDTVYRRLLKRLGRAYLTEDDERHAVFKCPKKLIRLPSAPRPRSEVQQKESVARGQALARAKRA